MLFDAIAIAELDIADYQSNRDQFMTLLENHYVPTGQFELIADFLETYEEAITMQDQITMTQMITSSIRAATAPAFSHVLVMALNVLEIHATPAFSISAK